MPKPRVLVLTSTFPARAGDGTPAFVADLALGLGSDHDVRILAPAVPGGAPRERLSDSVDVFRYRFFPRRWEDLADGAILENVRSRRSRLVQVPFFLLGQAIAVRREVRRFRPDVVHAHWIIPQGVVARAVGGRVPMIVTTLGGDLYALGAKPLRAAKSWVLRNARAVTVMNQDMRDKAIELGSTPETTHVMPMGAHLQDDLSDVETVSGSGALRVLAVGRLVEKKGFDVLLRALRRSDLAYELVIVGDGPEMDSLRRAADGLPVTFAGQLGRDSLMERYAAADVVAFPSRRAASGDQDGLPVALLEAMGSGRAVVVSDLPGLNEAVQDEASGLVVPAEDERALADALARLDGDAALRRRLGDAARDRAHEYSIPATVEKYRALLSTVLGR
ncbi:Glycosyltransferase involved in cell wall bisynthesis [Microbacterium sp. LKL04]|uniref:glycosyltransferase n=1 Tax=Microbacterium sp. LKL04 TaxID=912630 RepID=UPI000875D656|nr:glycosyltransferase [Microbacterium sp. LKL04]SCY41058.1 Glycosyltransferase involved in cell wall bisynthesis [Microbacterium sp. LKL04]